MLSFRLVLAVLPPPCRQILLIPLLEASSAVCISLTKAAHLEVTEALHTALVDLTNNMCSSSNSYNSSNNSKESSGEHQKKWVR